MTRRLVASLLLSVAVQGCGDAEAPDVAATISIAPDVIGDLLAGQSVALGAIVTGVADTRTQWRSANSSVATVDASGTVTAVDAGSTWITAALLAYPAVSDSISIRVIESPPGGPAPSITLTDLLIHGTNTSVDRDHVSGTIDVVSAYEIPPAYPTFASRVLLNGTEACRVVIADRDGTSVCMVDTAVMQDGQLRFPNGPATLRIDLIGTDGVIYATYTVPSLTLAN